MGGCPCDLCLTNCTTASGHMGTPPCEQNEIYTTENITFPQLSWRAEKLGKWLHFLRFVMMSRV